MSEQPKVNTRSFDLWFYAFGLLTVILVIYYQGLSVESAHSLIMMVFFRQMGMIWRNSIETGIRETDDILIRESLKSIEARIDKIDPYSEE